MMTPTITGSSSSHVDAKTGRPAQSAHDRLSEAQHSLITAITELRRALLRDADVAATADPPPAYLLSSTLYNHPLSATNTASDSSACPEVIRELPDQLWLRTLEHLDSGTVARLALTCHNMQDLLGIDAFRRLRLSKVSTNALLRHCEPSLPNLVHCEYCARYHARSAPASQSLKHKLLRPGGFEPYNCPEAKAYRQIPGPWSMLTWWHVHLIMRAHRLGPEFGVELATIQRANRSGLKFDARIWKDELIVRSAYPLGKDIPMGENDLLQRWRKKWTKNSCHHTSAPKKADHCKGMPEKCHWYKSPQSTETYFPRTTVLTCYSCPSEYCIEAEPTSPGHWTLSHVRYSRLGSCVSPWSLDWMQLTGPIRQPIDKSRKDISRDTTTLFDAAAGGPNSETNSYS